MIRTCGVATKLAPSTEQWQRRYGAATPGNPTSNPLQRQPEAFYPHRQDSLSAPPSRDASLAGSCYTTVIHSIFPRR